MLPADQLWRLLRRERQMALIGDDVRVFSGDQRRDARQRQPGKGSDRRAAEEMAWAARAATAARAAYRLPPPG